MALAPRPASAPPSASQILTPWVVEATHPYMLTKRAHTNPTPIPCTQRNNKTTKLCTHPQMPSPCTHLQGLWGGKVKARASHFYDSQLEQVACALHTVKQPHTRTHQPACSMHGKSGQASDLPHTQCMYGLPATHPSLKDCRGCKTDPTLGTSFALLELHDEVHPTNMWLRLSCVLTSAWNELLKLTAQGTARDVAPTAVHVHAQQQCERMPFATGGPKRGMGWDKAHVHTHTTLTQPKAWNGMEQSTHTHTTLTQPHSSSACSIQSLYHMYVCAHSLSKSIIHEPLLYIHAQAETNTHKYMHTHTRMHRHIHVCAHAHAPAPPASPASSPPRSL